MFFHAKRNGKRISPFTQDIKNGRRFPLMDRRRRIFYRNKVEIYKRRKPRFLYRVNVFRRHVKVSDLSILCSSTNVISLAVLTSTVLKSDVFRLLANRYRVCNSCSYTLLHTANVSKNSNNSCYSLKHKSLVASPMHFIFLYLNSVRYKYYKMFPWRRSRPEERKEKFSFLKKLGISRKNFKRQSPIYARLGICPLNSGRELVAPKACISKFTKGFPTSSDMIGNSSVSYKPSGRRNLLLTIRYKGINSLNKRLNMPLGHFFWHFIHKSIFLKRFINSFMRNGKKEKIEVALCRLLSSLKRKSRKQPIFLFTGVVGALQPILQHRYIMRSGQSYPVPIVIGHKRRLFSFFSFLKNIVEEFKKSANFKTIITQELISAAGHTGRLYRKIIDLHRSTFLNRINLRYIHKHVRKRRVFI